MDLENQSLDLENLIRYFKERLDVISAYDEAGTKQWIILRVLRRLGWDPDTEEVYPEYPLGGKKPDYALRLNSENKVFVEVKRPSEQLESHEEQLLQYAFRSSVRLSVLTNGILWWFYLPMREGDWQDRKFFAIDIRSQETSEIANNFRTYLKKEQVASGEAIERAETLLESKSRGQKIQQTLPRAWREIIDAADDLLVDLVADKVESLCGYKPEEKIIISFLRREADVLKTGSAIIKKTPPLISTPVPKTGRKKQYSGTMRDLIDARLVTPGQKIFRNYRGTDFVAQIMDDGTILFGDGHTESSISATGKHVTGSEDRGWTNWKTRNRSGAEVTLHDLRLQLPSHRGV